jgi:D-alanyl-D-alanine dipeptidase
MKIISIDELRKIKVIDNNEELVDLRVYSPLLKFNIASYVLENGGIKSKEDAHFVRKGFASKLNKAVELLPSGYGISIECGYRSPETQQKSYDEVYKALKKDNPLWNEQELRKEMENRVSEVDIAPHCTGGAVDLTILGPNNEELDMGTGTDEFSTDTYTDSLNISSIARNNRNILINVMTQAGFINFPAEWWHWSYGDREWAYHQSDKTAIYDTIHTT